MKSPKAMIYGAGIGLAIMIMLFAHLLARQIQPEIPPQPDQANDNSQSQTPDKKLTNTPPKTMPSHETTEHGFTV